MAGTRRGRAKLTRARCVCPQPVYIHPSSALFNHNPDVVCYHELVMTTKEYMREIIMIEVRAPRVVRRASERARFTLRKREGRS